MANANQIIINGETKIDLRNDTVTPSDLSEGVTAHNAAGNIIVGTAVRGLPVGFEYKQTNPNIQTGSLPLIGGVYDRTIYADLWAWVQTQGPYLITEAEWQALAEANGGAVPFYSDGDGSTTFRVPALTVYVKGTSSVESIGDYLADTFASHTHSVSAVTDETGAHTHSTDSQGAHTHAPKADSTISGSDYKFTLNNTWNTSAVARWSVAKGSDYTIMGSNTSATDSLGTNDINQGSTTASAGAHTHTAQSAGGHSHTVTITESTQGGEETRPKTIVGIYCVVAFGYVTSSGEVSLDAVQTLLTETQQTIANSYTICSEATERATDAPTYGLT